MTYDTGKPGNVRAPRSAEHSSDYKMCIRDRFLYGMQVMGDALKRSAGNKLKTILGRMTSNQFKGFLLGLVVTAIMQSSSATTVIVVGFVNSGTMTLRQSIGVIMGSNLGTAITSWLIGLSSLEGEMCIRDSFSEDQKF